MSRTALQTLRSLGHHIWIDDLHRSWLEDGTLADMIKLFGITGLTSNPAILYPAIVKSSDYNAAIAKKIMSGMTAKDLYEVLVIEDIQRAASLLQPIYDSTRGQDGYVSLEVSPKLARNSNATVEEATRLWKRVQQPNLLIKIPATNEGLFAIGQLIAEGINVNVTLLFGVKRYREVVDAYLRGLELRIRLRQPIDTIVSVASFFVSRIDTLADTTLNDLETDLATQLQGRIAVASAAVTYQVHQDLYNSKRWLTLAAHVKCSDYCGPVLALKTLTIAIPNISRH